jgi:hypothetical protein
MTHSTRYALLVFFAGGPALALGCAGERSEGLAATERLGGEHVVFDLEVKPLPEIPLPNDAAMRLDPSSPTGRRLNVSEQAPTALERALRRKYNRLDGFGAYAPISVRFTGPLDLAELRARHGTNDDFRDDAVYLVNVDPACSRYGEEIALDLGRGRFPVTLYKHGKRIPDPLAPGGYRVDDGGNTLFDLDPRTDYNNLLFEERNEDRNGNLTLDPGEDLDGDGALDLANFEDPAACDALEIGTIEYDKCIADHLLPHYERETHTLIARPVWPMEQRCRHAIILTKRLVDAQGLPVESPFPAVHHRDQTQALAPAIELLGRYGLGPTDIAFAWSFTVGSQTTDLEALRAGLHGAGPFSRLAEELPVKSFRFWTAGELVPGSPDPDVKRIAGPCGGEALNRFWADGVGEWEPNRCALEAELSSVGGFAGGEFEAPNLLADRDGIATDEYPADDNESWDIDAGTGSATYGTSKVTFWCALPVEKDTSCSPGNPEGKPFCKPFPVVLYAHGYGGSRAEILGFLGRHTSMGVAMCGVDSYGHGLNRVGQDIFAAAAFSALDDSLGELGAPALKQMILRGRDRDLDNDGKADSGGDMWSADIFHTRDMVRQSVLEYMQMVRMLRSMDGAALSADGSVLGDMDGDGGVDIGGPANTVAMWGISLGGVLTGVAAGAEPGLDAASPNAGGAGLADVAVRSAQAGVPEEVHLPTVGPFLAGCLPVDDHQNPLPPGAPPTEDCLTGGKSDDEGGTLRLTFLLHAIGRYQRIDLGAVTGILPGDRVHLSNLDNGEEKTVTIDPRGRFRVAVPADALSPTERRPLLGLTDDDDQPVSFEATPLLADRLKLTVLGPDGAEKAVVDTFLREVEFQGTVYPEGAPLVALQEGFALERNTPELRRFLGLAAHALGPADPAVWAARYFLEPPDVSAYDPNVPKSRVHVLVMPTLGDRNVPVNTGIAHGRAAGLFGSWLREPDKYGPEHGWRELFTPDPRYGKPVDQELIDTYVVEGDARLQRYLDNPKNPNVLYDIDNVSDGAAQFSCGPSDWSALVGESGCPPEIDGQEVFFGVPAPAPGKELRQNRAAPPPGGATRHLQRAVVPRLRRRRLHGQFHRALPRVARPPRDPRAGVRLLGERARQHHRERREAGLGPPGHRLHRRRPQGLFPGVHCRLGDRHARRSCVPPLTARSRPFSVRKKVWV